MRAGLDLSYRQSNVAGDEVVLTPEFEGEPGDVAVGKTRMREITRWRKEHQPGGTLNAGSVFKNPEGVTAGELIDRLGLKGTQCRRRQRLGETRQLLRGRARGPPPQMSSPWFGR